eukprot:gene17417-biopygen18881
MGWTGLGGTDGPPHTVRTPGARKRRVIPAPGKSPALLLITPGEEGTHT